MALFETSGAEDPAVIVRRAEGVVERRMLGETFLVPIHGHVADLQELFVLNEVGSWIWERLDGRSLDSLLEELVQEFEVKFEQARSDALEFLGELVKTGLAVTTSGSAE